MNEKHCIRHYHNPIWCNQISVLQFLFKFLFLASLLYVLSFHYFLCKGRPGFLICKRSKKKTAKDISNNNLKDDIPLVPALQNLFHKSVISVGCHRKKSWVLKQLKQFCCHRKKSWGFHV